MLWSSVARVRSGRRTGRPGLAQTVERLRTGHLVHEVEVDEEQVRLALGRADDVVVPDLLAQCLAHGPSPFVVTAPLPTLPPVRAVSRLAFQHPRRQYQGMDNSSGVGVLDKAALVLSALETGPTTLAGLVSATGLARPTAHRLAVALEHHRLVSRDLQGRFILGPRLGELASAAGEDRLLATAGPGAGPAARHHRRVGPDVPPARRLPGLRRHRRADVGTARQRAGRHPADHDRRIGRPGAAGLGGAGPDAARAARQPLLRGRPGRRTPSRLGALGRRARGRAWPRSRPRCAPPPAR